MPIAPREAELFWHQCVLVVILVVAACTRFYSLDQLSLSADELVNLSICHTQGWLDMVVANQSHSGMTPLYPILLRLFTNLSTNTEFFLRSLSALTGLAAIYFIYITGRDFISPVAGLLAAAIMATEYQLVFVNRDATLYTSLLLWCLMHNYYFCRLFFSGDDYNKRALVIESHGSVIDFTWTWHPRFPADARCLAGFWISGMLAFYTSPMTLIQLSSEVLVSAFLIRRAANHFPHWRSGMNTLWLPLLVAILLWLPMLYRSWLWILQGNLFGFQSPLTLWQHIQAALPNYPALQMLLIALTLLFILFITTHRLLKKNYLLAVPLMYFITLQFGIALISLWLLLPASHLSYLYYWWTFILLIMIPVSSGIDSLPAPAWKKWIVTIAILLVVVVQVKSNAYYKLYAKEKSGDFRLAAKIIHDDQDFIKGHRDIVMSSDLFRHHLEESGILRNNLTLLDVNTPSAGDDSAPENHSAFYYLEYAPYDRQLKNESPAVQALAAQYKVICITQMPWIQVVKFSRDTPVTTNEIQDCRHQLSGAVALK